MRARAGEFFGLLGRRTLFTSSFPKYPPFLRTDFFSRMRLLRGFFEAFLELDFLEMAILPFLCVL